jgi:hypothetical protein
VLVSELKGLGLNVELTSVKKDISEDDEEAEEPTQV